MKQTLLSAASALTLCFTMCLVNPQTGYAADVSCVSHHFTSEELKHILPSGRKPTPSTCSAIWISGSIVKGDADKFLHLLQQNHPFISMAYISSPGGNAPEAMKIGRLIRKYLLVTHAPVLQYDLLTDGQQVIHHERWGNLYTSFPEPKTLCERQDCYCASACFLIWAAGSTRYGEVLGIHRPSIHSQEFENLPPDQAATVYRIVLADMREYLREMEIPQHFIEEMTDTASNEINWVSMKDAETMAHPPSISETFLASCDGLTNDEGTAWASLLFQRGSAGRLSEEQQASLNSLQAKLDSSDNCRQNKISTFRDSFASVHEP